jgi:hypothetical protein
MLTITLLVLVNMCQRKKKSLTVHFYKNKIDWVTECLKKRKLFGRWNEDYDKKQFGLPFSNSLMI